MAIEDLTIDEIPAHLVRQISGEAIEHYHESLMEASADPDHPDHWGVSRAQRYSSDDETAMAAFNYPCDSAEVDRWR